MGRTTRAVVFVDGVGRTVLQGPTVHLRLHVLAFAGHFRIHLSPVQLALQCSPLQSISQPQLVHDRQIAHPCGAKEQACNLPLCKRTDTSRWHDKSGCSFLRYKSAYTNYIKGSLGKLIYNHP